MNFFQNSQKKVERKEVFVTLIRKEFMKKVYRMESRGYYLIESLAVCRNCYFESKEEAERFKNLFVRYVGSYVEIDKMYLSSSGYHILLRIKSFAYLRNRYTKECNRRGKQVRGIFIEEPWRIISEQMRIFHSRYVKWINEKRDRSGGMVKERYSRYYFSSEEEYEIYKNKMGQKEQLKGQRNKRYELSERWLSLVNWEVLRGGEWVNSLMNRAFRKYVVEKLVKSTIILHNTPP